MNSFLEIHTSSDYRINQRDYHKSTWEYINAASDSLPPFQWAGSSDADFSVTKYTTAGASSSITGKFWEATSLITGWTLAGTGTWTVASDSVQIAASNTDSGDVITSNTFSLTAKKSIFITIDETKFTDLADWRISLYKGGSPVAGVDVDDWSAWNGEIYFTAVTTGADYDIRIETDNNAAVVTTNIPTAYQSVTYRSGLYHWYNGSTLSISGTNFTDIFRFKLSHNSVDYFTDWIDPCEYTDLSKIKISSSYDYGGVKYVDGYEQYMYKSAVIRRSPKAEIEIIGDTLNGERINEKITSAVRYTMKMKCSEPEWEALVHGIAGTLEITDADGKVYDPQNVELNDPAWFNGNGIVELTFVDGNNINVWTRNNSDL